MNKDRGIIKWTAMMLPEHVEKLREWHIEHLHEPLLEKEEWQLEHNDHMIRQAILQQCPVTLQCYSNNQWQHFSNCIIKRFDSNKQLLKVLLNQQLIEIPLHELQHISVDDLYD